MEYPAKGLQELIQELRGFLDDLELTKDLLQPPQIVDKFQAVVNYLRTSLGELQAAHDELNEQRRLLEESRRVAEAEHQRFRDLFEFAPDGYIVTSPSAVIQEVNYQAARLLNVSPQFAQNTPLLLFVHESDRGKFYSALAGLGAKSTMQEWEFRLQPAGEKSPFEAAITVVPQRHEGRSAALRWTIRDVTERKQAEKALHREKERAQEYLDVAGAIIIVLDSEGTVAMINRSGSALIGCEQSEIIGKNWFDHFLPERIRTDLLQAFHRFIRGGCKSEYWSQENPIITRGGHERLIEWRNITLKDDSGRVKGTLSSGQDVTERRRTEELLRQEKEFTEYLINSTTDGIIAFDLNFRCTVWNPAMERLSGIRKENTLDRNIFELFPFLKEDQRDKCFLSAVAGQQVSTRDSPYLIPGTGQMRYYDSEFSPMRDHNGNIIGGLALIRDVTERKLAEESLRESEIRYRHLSESLEATVQRKVSDLQQAQSLAAIGQVISVVAHEIRNPLQNIHMGVDLLRQLIERPEQGPTDSLEVLGEIDYGVSQLNTIVSDLLEYAKPVKLKISTWQFQDVLKRALAALSEKLHGISVNLKLEHGNVALVADADKIMRVLVNLIDNAAEAMPAGGTLIVRSRITECDETKLFLFSIQDTGVGIDQETLKRIHEPFFTTKTQGTGLGLSICRKIIQAHSGCIHFQSKVGEGTTAEILLPLKAPEAAIRSTGPAGRSV